MDIEKVRVFTTDLLFGMGLGVFVGVVGIPMWLGIGPYAV